MSVTDYSTTAGANVSISGINIAEGCSPGNINDAIRQMMADVRVFYNGSVLQTGEQTIGGVKTFSSALAFTGAGVADGTLTALGGGAGGVTVFKAATADAALDALGATTTGKAVVTAADAAAVRAAAGIVALTKVQAEDPASSVSGTVSGQRLAEAHDARTVARRFESAEQEVPTVSGTPIEVPHGLGAVPFGSSVALRCKTAEGGWSVGDEFPMVHYHTTGIGISAPYATDTVVGWQYVSARPQILEKGSATVFAFTPASWRLVFRAWL